MRVEGFGLDFVIFFEKVFVKVKGSIVGGYGFEWFKCLGFLLVFNNVMKLK